MNAFHKNTDLKKLHLNGGFEIFTALKIQVEVFWVLMPSQCRRPLPESVRY